MTVPHVITVRCGNNVQLYFRYNGYVSSGANGAVFAYQIFNLGWADTGYEVVIKIHTDEEEKTAVLQLRA